VSPSSQTVAPGGSADFTVTVTPLNGFTGTVTLSVDAENGFAPGVTSSDFVPATLPASGSSTFTMSATTDSLPWATTLSVHGVSGSITHTTSSTFVVNLAPPDGLAASTSDSAVNLTWNPSEGAMGYRVARSAGGAYQTIACPADTTYADSGLVNGTTYHYVVSATFVGGDDGGGGSIDSGEILATPPCATPTYTGSLRGSKSGGSSLAWSWTAGGASKFDLLQGDLTALRSTGGNFKSALDALPAGVNACLANDTTALSLADPYGAPSAGGAEFTLLRPVAVACVAFGTLDEGVPSQVGSRDSGVEASPRACP
jgi:hypothetical protein